VIVSEFRNPDNGREASVIRMHSKCWIAQLDDSTTEEFLTEHQAENFCEDYILGGIVQGAAIIKPV